MTKYCGGFTTAGHGSSSVCGQPVWGPDSELFQCDKCKIAELQKNADRYLWLKSVAPHAIIPLAWGKSKAACEVDSDCDMAIDLAIASDPNWRANRPA